jgi:hypothetical protein
VLTRSFPATFLVAAFRSPQVPSTSLSFPYGRVSIADPDEPIGHEEEKIAEIARTHEVKENWLPFEGMRDLECGCRVNGRGSSVPTSSAREVCREFRFSVEKMKVISMTNAIAQMSEEL